MSPSITVSVTVPSLPIRILVICESANTRPLVALSAVFNADSPSISIWLNCPLTPITLPLELMLPEAVIWPAKAAFCDESKVKTLVESVLNTIL